MWHSCGSAYLIDLGIKSLNNRLLSIQALRGIASTSVVMAHAWSTVMGTTGVDLFFIISGFTMVYASKSQFGNRSAVVPFLYRRFLRIYPVYWAATAFFIAVFGLHVDTRLLITSLLLVMDNHNPVMDPAWTLIFEVMFYIIFAFLLPLALRKAVVAICAILSTIVLTGLFLPYGIMRLYANPIILEFGFGCIAAVAYCGGLRFNRLVSLALICAALVWLLVLALHGGTASFFAWRPLFWGLPMLAIFCGVVFGPPIEALSWSGAQVLGDASYSIYLTHWTIIALSSHFGGPLQT